MGKKWVKRAKKQKERMQQQNVSDYIAPCATAHCLNLYTTVAVSVDIVT